MAGQVMCCSCMMWELADPIANCSDHICSKCWLLEEIWLRVDELESDLQTLRHIRERDVYLNAVFHDAVTPGRLITSNLVSGQGVTDIGEGRGCDPVAVVHAGTNNIGKTRKEDLFRDYQELGTKLKNRSSRVIISGLLPEPHANWHRGMRIREVNTWLKE
eukprot:g48491.t1